MPTTDRLFVIGSGGREHALVWHLRQWYPSAALYCAPGNAGIARLANCLPVSTSDLHGLVEAAADLRPRLTIFGPEAPLVAGIADRFETRRLPVIGPTAAAAAIEGSKAFAKALMYDHGIPTARFAVFDDPEPAGRFIERFGGPVVVKADGLAAGKGVVVCDDVSEARDAVHAMLVRRAFGDAGARIVVEERLTGEEVSVFALVDGETVALLAAVRDHKRAHDGDRGPNTGGMGAVAPVPLDADLRAQIMREVIQPTARALCAIGRPYRGVLFAGLMLTIQGLRVLEFNCRLGDPETQVMLPLMSLGLPDAFHALREAQPPETLMRDGGEAVGVVLASRGYPGPADTGHPITGLDDAERDALVFHSGTALRNGRIVTAGGRVLTVVGQGPNMDAARSRAYDAVERIAFDGMTYRRDIGARVPRAAAGGSSRSSTARPSTAQVAADRAPQEAPAR